MSPENENKLLAHTCTCFKGEKKLTTVTLRDWETVVLCKGRSEEGNIKAGLQQKKKAAVGTLQKRSKRGRGAVSDELLTKTQQIITFQGGVGILFFPGYLKAKSDVNFNFETHCAGQWSASSACCQSGLTYCFRSWNERVCRCRHKPAFGKRN